MHVALLANTSWLDEELALFRHMVVGLIDEQVRVAQIVPDALQLDELSPFGEQLTFTESRLTTLNRQRLRQLSPALGQMNTELIHVLDGALWWPGLVLARALDAAVLLQANAADDLRRVERLDRMQHLGGDHLAFAATTQPLADAMTSRVGERNPVYTLRPGVHVQQEPSSARTGDNPLAAVVSGNGQLDGYYQALLAGMARLIKERPQSQFFFDGQGSDQQKLWREAERLGLLANMSFVPRRLGHREMLLRADVVIQPQPLARSRSLTLQAMAHSLPVLAQDDPWLDYLIPDTTAWVVNEPTPRTLQSWLRRITDDPEAVQALGTQARQWVRENRLASDQIAKALEVYRQMTGAAIPFSG
jgi:hypothetical protein